MAIPKIPPILTEADWNKNQGAIAKVAGAAPLGALLKKVKRHYDDVHWGFFDIQRALRPGASPEIAQHALEVAQAEYQRTAPLLEALKRVEFQAALTRDKFSKNKLIPKASTQYADKVSKAARLMRAQLETVPAEFDAFRKAAQQTQPAPKKPAVPKKPLPARPNKPPAKKKLLPNKPLPRRPTPPQPPTVKETLGEQWFADLRKIEYDNHDWLAWANDPELALIGEDDRPDQRIVELQTDVKEALASLKNDIHQILALENKHMEAPDAQREVIAIWTEIGRSMFVITWTLSNGHQERLHQVFARDFSKIAVWEKNHARLVALNKQVRKSADRNGSIWSRLAKPRGA